jgi:hypothetical protein
MTTINVGDLLRTNSWFGVVMRIDEGNNYEETAYMVHWFFPDNRNPISMINGYNALKYRINVLTILGK